MYCKNCTASLRTDFSFCPSCGAKVIRNRLTVKNIWFDITERFFNIDNTFLSTFLHLFTKPHIVIEGYLAGVRKKYVNPVSYMAIALTLTGLMLFFLKRSFPEGLDFDLFNTGVYDQEVAKKMTDFMFTFHSALFLLYIPILAGCGYIAFKKKAYNYPEFVITFIYTQAQLSLFAVGTTLLVLAIAPDWYMSFSMISLLITIGYSLYVMKKMSNQTRGEFLFSVVAFLFMFGVGFALLSIIQNIAMANYIGLSFIEMMGPKR